MKSLSVNRVNHFLTLDNFDMWLCFDVGPFKTLQFEKSKINKSFFKIPFSFWFLHLNNVFLDLEFPKWLLSDNNKKMFWKTPVCPYFNEFVILYPTLRYLIINRSKSWGRHIKIYDVVLGWSRQTWRRWHIRTTFIGLCK